MIDDDRVHELELAIFGILDAWNTEDGDLVAALDSARTLVGFKDPINHAHNDDCDAYRPGDDGPPNDVCYLPKGHLGDHWDHITQMRWSEAESD
jgi:hypothetical protein